MRIPTRLLVPALLALPLCVGACGDDKSAAPSGSTGPSSSSGSGGGQAGGGGQGGSSAGGGGSAPVPQKRYLFVANRDSDTITSYGIDAEGALSQLDEVQQDSPAPLAVDPLRTVLYAGSLQPQTVTAYNIDHASGALTSIATTPLGARPVYLAVDHLDSTLLMASYGGNVAASFALAPGGTVMDGAVSSHNTGTNPHSIIVHPTNAFAFVPNTNSDSITQLLFDAGNHTLTLNTPAQLPTEPGAGPRHMVFHPAGSWLYAVNEHADSVTRYTLEQDGTLSTNETVSTLPNGADGSSNTCADIHITPDGSFLYASNRGHDSLAMFAVEPNGTLTPLGHQATEPTPREFEITPDGRFLYAAGQASDQLAAYRIDTSGTLSPLATYPVGQAPLWVLAISVDDPAAGQ